MKFNSLSTSQPDSFFLFFFNDTAPTEIYTTRHTLSLHDALPIYLRVAEPARGDHRGAGHRDGRSEEHTSELQSRLVISYAVFCLKKKKIKKLIEHSYNIVKIYYNVAYMNLTFSI